MECPCRPSPCARPVLSMHFVLVCYMRYNRDKCDKCDKCDKPQAEFVSKNLPVKAGVRRMRSKLGCENPL